MLSRAQEEEERSILVLDVGDGFKTSLLIVEDGIFEILASKGDDSVGGSQIDSLLATYCARVFKEQSGLDVSHDSEALCKLRLLCEAAKSRLTSKLCTVVRARSFCQGHDLSVKINRDLLDQLMKPMMQKIVETIDGLLAIPECESRVGRAVNEIFMIGGASRIPRIQQVVRQYFNNRDISSKIRVDQVVACGALAFAKKILAEPVVSFCCALELTILAVGIKLADGTVDQILTRGRTIPCRFSKAFTVR